MTYSEKLKDPRWQKKRLEILERDGWACRRCFSKEKPLNVHHVNYQKGAAPWEYEDSWLVSMCEDCHTLIESDIRYLRSSIVFDRQRYLVLFALMLDSKDVQLFRFAEEVCAFYKMALDARNGNTDSADELCAQAMSVVSMLVHTKSAAVNIAYGVDK